MLLGGHEIVYKRFGPFNSCIFASANGELASFNPNVSPLKWTHLATFAIEFRRMVTLDIGGSKFRIFGENQAKDAYFLMEYDVLTGDSWSIQLDTSRLQIFPSTFALPAFLLESC